MNVLLVIFFALNLTLPTWVALDQNDQPYREIGMMYEDNSIAIHACYDGYKLYDVQVGQFALIGDTLYQVGMTEVFPENAYVGNWDVIIYTCWREDLWEACFVTNEGWDYRFVIGLQEIRKPKLRR